MSNARCTRGVPGFCIRHEATAYNETGWAVTVEYGVADTVWTAPAKATVKRNGKGIYGYVTGDENSHGERILRFVEVTDQRAAKAAYRASIQY